MAAKKKMSACEAKRFAKAAGVDFSKDFHALPSSQVQTLADTAKAAGYRKSKNAPGSTARMFFQRLDRAKGC